MISKALFELEIENNIPLLEQPDLPQGIKNVFLADTSEYNILTKTLLYIELANSKNPVGLYKCYNKDYFVPINSNFVKMINYPEPFTIYQGKENSPVHFVGNDSISIIIMPIHNRGIKEKLQSVVN